LPDGKGLFVFLAVMTVLREYVNSILIKVGKVDRYFINLGDLLIEAKNADMLPSGFVQQLARQSKR
jgi:hypothetical protein